MPRPFCREVLTNDFTAAVGAKAKDWQNCAQQTCIVTRTTRCRGAFRVLGTRLGVGTHTVVPSSEWQGGKAQILMSLPFPAQLEKTPRSAAHGVLETHEAIVSTRGGVVK